MEPGAASRPDRKRKTLLARLKVPILACIPTQSKRRSTYDDFGKMGGPRRAFDGLPRR
jgi:hypothetical protein